MSAHKILEPEGKELFLPTDKVFFEISYCDQEIFEEGNTTMTQQDERYGWASLRQILDSKEDLNKVHLKYYCDDKKINV